MKRALVVFAGRSRCGKTTLASRLAAELGLQRSTFSDAVRRAVSAKHPGSAQSLALLQDIGAKLVSEDPAGFVREACAQVDLSRQRCGVLDGLRHKTLIPHLRALYPDATVFVIYVEASPEVRAKRCEPAVTLQRLAEIDSHPVEAEEDALREMADLVLTTDCLEAESFDLLYRWLKSRGCCLPKRKRSHRLRVAFLFARAWIIVSVFWMIGVTVYLHTDAGRQWTALERGEKVTLQWGFSKNLLPLSCSQAKGAEGLDFFRFQGHCWMLTAHYRVLNPEASQMDDRTLQTQSYKAASLPTAQGTSDRWLNESEAFIRRLLLVPFTLLLTGIAAIWLYKGNVLGLLSAEDRLELRSSLHAVSTTLRSLVSGSQKK